MSDFFKEVYTMEKATNLGEILKVFSPFALSGETYNEFYVETSAARGEEAAKQIITRFKYNSDMTKKLLFMGHNGSGKSTELFKVEKELQNEYLVVNFSIREETDVVNLQHFDLIFAILNNIFSTVKDLNYRISEKALNNIVSYWNDEKILSLVEESNIDISSTFEAKVSWLSMVSAKIKGVFQTGVNAKQEIRKKMEPTMKQLLTNINQFVDEIQNEIAPKKILLIIEDLDKIDIDKAKSLFIDNRKTITSINVDTVYTFPIYLFYSEYYNEILSDFDADVLLSMIKVKNIDGTPFEDGRKTLIEIVKKRCEESLFEANVLSFFVEKSGGSIRDLFSMINNAALTSIIRVGDNGKITMDVAISTYYSFKSKRERIIKKDHLPILIEIYKDKAKKPFGDNQDLLMQLLQAMCVIEYNGKRWCDLHPAILDYLIEKEIFNEPETVE